MQLTVPQIADAWMAAGGPRRRATEFVSISLAESSGETDAVSPVGAKGLWQIMPFWFPDLGLPASEWDNPKVNARAAVIISGGGTNCAAWDTCYRDIEATGRYKYLRWPEQGSAAWENLQHVATVLGQDKLGGSAPNGGTFPDQGIAHAVSHYQFLANKVFPDLDRLMIAQRMYVRTLYTPGRFP